MITFLARLMLGSSRWVAPTTVLLLWMLLVTSNPGEPLSDASALFMAFAVWGTWMTITAGSIDDDHHHDLLAARAGSSASGHASRALAVLVLSGAPVAFGAALVTFLREQSGRSQIYVAIASAGLFLAGSLFGVGIGTALHRPVLRHRGLSFLGGTLLLSGLVLLPPVQSVLQNYDRGDATSGVWLLAVAGLAAGVVGAASAWFAQSRAR